MKIVYCMPSVFNSGGMERILSIKTNYLADILGYEVIIVTTDQKNRERFFLFSDKIKFIDLNINYCDKEINNILTILNRILKVRQHKIRLSTLLMQIKPDITISMFQNEASFLPSIKDGSAKIIESHFCRYYRQLSQGNIIRRFLSKIRAISDNRIIRSFDRFVTLTDEDRLDWPNYYNISVIPNPITIMNNDRTSLNHKTVLAVGRITFQKGFMLLIRAWKIVEDAHPDWTLNIVGAQDDILYLNNLNQLISDLKLKNVRLKLPTKNIVSEYLGSDFLVMSSIYEGLPLVLLEGMSLGLPAVSFACKCGPKDIIDDGENGFLIPPENYQMLGEQMNRLIENPELLCYMSHNALKKSYSFSLEHIMAKWDNLFNEVCLIND